MRILWDEPKRLANIDKHGLDFAEVRPDFFDVAVVRLAKRNRMLALGPLDGQLVALIFSSYGKEAISLVSLRVASAKERQMVAWRKN